MSRPLTRRGGATLIAGGAFAAIGWALGSQLFVGFGTLLIAAVTFGLVLVHVLPVRVRVARRVSTDLMSVGELAHVTMIPTVRSLVPVHVTWRDAAGDGLSGTVTGVTKLYARTSDPIAYDFTALARGRYTIGPVIFTLEDPFGFSYRLLATDATSEVFVAPRVAPWDPESPGVSESGSSRGAAHEHAHATAVDVIPRPFHPGDSVRRVHWRATARSGELMVRQETLETSPELHVVLDLHRARWAERKSAGVPTFEQAVSVCASVAVGAVAQGYHVTVSDETGNVLEALDGAADATRALLRTLAEVMPRSDEESPWRIHPSSQSHIIVIAGNLSSADAHSLAQVHQRGKRTLYTPDRSPGVGDALARAGWKVLPLVKAPVNDARVRGVTRASR